MSLKHGFTLIEMAIVLVIVSLLIGSIVAGQSMVRAAQLHNMIDEYDTYVQAIKEFQDKYLTLPGDMAGTAGFTAEDMWGTDPNGCPLTPSSTTPQAATCNGDGSGTIGSSTTAGVQSNTREWFRAWQQLSDAGFVAAQFTGTPGSVGVADAIPGVNIPISSVSGGGWTLNYLLLTSNGSLWADQYGHILDLGAYKSGGAATNPVLQPVEAFAIDQKIDDGKPGRGRIRTWRTSVLPNCTTSDTTQDAQSYDPSHNGQLACSLVFLLGY